MTAPVNSNIELYVSSTAFKTFEEAIDFCNEKHVNLEISKFTRADIVDNSTEEDFNRIKELFAKNKHIKKVLHGTSFDLTPTSFDSKIIEVTLYRLVQSVELARFFDVETVVFHSGYNPQVKFESYIENFVEKQIEFWISFIKDNKINDLTIALENTYEDNPYILKKIYDGVNSKYFKTCIDTGHVNCFSNYNLCYWTDCLKDYLSHIHLHNNNGSMDQHQSVINGTLNFEDFFQLLLNSNGKLSLTLEMFEKKYIAESLEFIRKNFQL